MITADFVLYYSFLHTSKDGSEFYASAFRVCKKIQIAACPVAKKDYIEIDGLSEDWYRIEKWCFCEDGTIRVFVKEHLPTDYCLDELIELENEHRKLGFTVSVLSDQYLAAKQKFLDRQREADTVESNCL